MAAEELHYYHSDSDLLPDGVADAWVVVGGGTRTVENEGVKIVSIGGRASYRKQLFATDTDTSPARFADRYIIQGTITGVAKVAGGGPDSPIGLLIDDGERALTLNIGDDLELVDPATGTVLKTIKTGHAWLMPTFYRFIKDRSDQWVVFVNMQEVGFLPYDLAGASASPSHRAEFGHVETNGSATSTAFYQGMEAGLNLDPPQEWRVERVFLSLPISIQERFTKPARAALRATAGLYESIGSRLDGVFGFLTAARKDIKRFFARGDIDPTKLNPAWVKTGLGHGGEVRQRRRLDTHPGIATSSWDASFDAPATDEEAMVRARITLRETVPDANGRVGPFLYMSVGTKEMAAELVEIVAGESYGWVLTDAALAGAVVVLGQAAWRVDPFQTNFVEMQLLGQDWLLLIVNGHIVDRVAYADLTTIGASNTGSMGVIGNTAQVDFEDMEAVRRHADLKHRPVFLQNAVERLIFVGGCERNDELETWMQRHHQVQQLRGATRGIIMELMRMTCSEDVFVVSEVEEGDWFLEVSYPEVTPIFLEFGGQYRDIYVEFPVGSTNFSPQELADLAVVYLVPFSTTELTYHLALATLTTGPHVVVASTFEFPVKSADGFAAGDTVTIRDFANTLQVTTTVVSVDLVTPTIVLPDTVGVFATGSVIRKELATS